MKSVRIEPSGSFNFLVDITCDCGRNGPSDESGNPNFKHPIKIGVDQLPKILTCACGKQFRLRPQTGHVHVDEL